MESKDKNIWGRGKFKVDGRGERRDMEKKMEGRKGKRRDRIGKCGEGKVGGGGIQGKDGWKEEENMGKYEGEAGNRWDMGKL